MSKFIAIIKRFKKDKSEICRSPNPHAKASATEPGCTTK